METKRSWLLNLAFLSVLTSIVSVILTLFMSGYNMFWPMSLQITNIASSVATGTFALSMSSTGYRVHQYLSLLSIFNLSVHFIVDLVYSPESAHGVVETRDPLYGVFIQKHIRYPILVLEAASVVSGLMGLVTAFMVRKDELARRWIMRNRDSASQSIREYSGPGSRRSSKRVNPYGRIYPTEAFTRTNRTLTNCLLSEPTIKISLPETVT